MILFCIGMCFAKNIDRIQENKGVVVALFVGTLAITTILCKFVQINRCQIDRYFPFGGGINPPSISLCMYAILIAFTLLFLEKVLSTFDLTMAYRLLGGFAFLGRYTLHIFYIIDYF